MTKHAPADFNISAWPALLTTEMACAYTQLSEASFRFAARKHGVAPVDFGGLAVTRWSKSDLDRMIDSLPRRSAEMPSEPANTPVPEPDPGAAALARVKARAKG